MEHLLFKYFPQRQRLIKGNDLVGDKIYFEEDAGPDWEPVKFSTKAFTAGVLKRSVGYAC